MRLHTCIHKDNPDSRLDFRFVLKTKLRHKIRKKYFPPLERALTMAEFLHGIWSSILRYGTPACKVAKKKDSKITPNRQTKHFSQHVKETTDKDSRSSERLNTKD